MHSYRTKIYVFIAFSLLTLMRRILLPYNQNILTCKVLKYLILQIVLVGTLNVNNEHPVYFTANDSKIVSLGYLSFNCTFAFPSIELLIFTALKIFP